MGTRFFLLLQLYLSVLASGISARPVRPCNVTEVSENDVIKFIFANYSKRGRPRRNASSAVKITVGLRLAGIVQFNERQSTLVLNGYVYMDWEDEYLYWESSYPYYCVDYLLIKQEDVWTPDLLILNAEDVYSLVVSPGGKVWLAKDGYIQFTPAYQMALKCELDLTLFPFDTQICSVRIESWNYPSYLQSLHLSKRPFMKIEASWTENKQWQLIDYTSRAGSYRTFDGLSYDAAIFTLLIRRKTLFYYINTIVPSVIIAIVELVTFVLPIEDVIRVHISFTCLLAYSMFQTMIIGDLPRSSDNVPLLSLYIDLQMAYIGVIALLGEGIVFLLIRRARLRQAKPPICVFHFFRGIGRCLLVDYRFTMGASVLISDDEPARRVVTSPDLPATARRRPSKFVSIEGPLREIHDQWLYIAEVIERINMWLYIVAISITPAVMFHVLPPEKTLDHDGNKTMIT